MKNKDTQQLAVSVYVLALRKQIEEEVHSKYWKRINYLVGANNELMKELERCESETVTVEKEHVKKVVEEVVDEWRGATCNSHLTGPAIL